MLLFYSVGREKIKSRGIKQFERRGVTPDRASQLRREAYYRVYTGQATKVPRPPHPQLRREAHYRVYTGQTQKVCRKVVPGCPYGRVVGLRMKTMSRAIFAFFICQFRLNLGRILEDIPLYGVPRSGKMSSHTCHPGGESSGKPQLPHRRF